MTRILCFLLPGLLPLTLSFAQTRPDTLEQARNLRDAHHIAAADSLLRSYLRDHSDDADALWLCGQIEYWLERFEAADSLYERAIRVRPGDYYLQLDYAKVLIDFGAWDRAAAVLKPYDTDHPDSAAAQVLLARIAYWRGDYVRADACLDRITGPDPPDAQSLRREVHLARAPWIRFTSVFRTDNQPLDVISPSLEAGLFLDPLATVRLTVRTPQFFKDGQTLTAPWLQLGNTANFQGVGLALDVDAGLMQHPHRHTLSGTGRLGLRQRLARAFLVEASASRTPYFNTRTSLDTALMVRTMSTSLAWENRARWSGKAGVEAQRFPDANTVLSVFAWVLSPPLRLGLARIRAGYGYNFSTARENRFAPRDALTDIVASYDPATGVAGEYRPYFTPRRQHIHSVSASVEAFPAPSLTVGGHAGLGVYAVAQHPYLFLDTDGTGGFVVARGFARRTFTPAEVNVFIRFALAETVSLRIEYAYARTNFYESHFAGITFGVSL